jgi:hypothetical protein
MDKMGAPFTITIQKTTSSSLFAATKLLKEFETQHSRMTPHRRHAACARCVWHLLGCISPAATSPRQEWLTFQLYKARLLD